MILRVLLIALLGAAFAAPAMAAPAAELWPFWRPATPDPSLRIDHRPWQTFLDRYLVRGADGINRVRYTAVTSADRTALDAYLSGLTAVDPRRLPDADARAYWINLYNALTVRVVLDHPGKTSILRMGGGWLPRGPWDDKLVTVAGEAVTLNDIEHRILRPIWKDHRIHYAVNCASLGCPNLNAHAYTGDNLERLLSDGERDYINHWRGVQLGDDGRLYLSSIYKWYGTDFAPDRAGLLTYLSRHHITLAESLQNFSGSIRYRYDWTLNAAP